MSKTCQNFPQELHKPLIISMASVSVKSSAPADFPVDKSSFSRPYLLDFRLKNLSCLCFLYFCFSIGCCFFCFVFPDFNLVCGAVLT